MTVQPTEHHLEVTRTARYWTMGEPSRADEVWFVLHGYKQLARRFLRRFEGIAGAERAIVAPEALSRFYASTGTGRHGASSVVGATWMTREDREREIADYVRYLDALADRLAVEGRRVTVLGFSQGVATAARWTVLGRMRPARLLLWGDFVPPDLELEAARTAWSGTDVVLVRGDADRALDPRLAADEADRLERAGLVPRRVGYTGGHDIEANTLARLVGATPTA